MTHDLMRKQPPGERFLSASILALAAILTTVTPNTAWAQGVEVRDDRAPRTSASDRANKPGSLRYRILDANARYAAAVRACDEAAAHAQLVELYNLAEEARRTEEAARAAGVFAAIHPEDAWEDYRFALERYQRAREVGKCVEERAESAAERRRRAQRSGGTVPPVPQREPIDDVIGDMEDSAEGVLGPTFGRRPANEGAGEPPLPELGEPLGPAIELPRPTIGSAPGVGSASSGVGSAANQARVEEGGAEPARAGPVPTNRLDLERWRWLLGTWRIPGGGAIQFQLAANGTVSGVLVEGSERLEREGYKPGQLVLREWRYGGSNGHAWKFWANEGQSFSAAKPGACCGSPLINSRWEKGGVIHIDRGEDRLEIPAGRLTNHQKLTRK